MSLIRRATRLLKRLKAAGIVEKWPEEWSDPLQKKVRDHLLKLQLGDDGDLMPPSDAMCKLQALEHVFDIECNLATLLGGKAVPSSKAIAQQMKHGAPKVL